LAQDMAESALGAAKDGSVKVLIVVRGSAPHAALGRHVKDEQNTTQDVAQDVAQDVTQDVTQGVAHGVAGGCWAPWRTGA